MYMRLVDYYEYNWYPMKGDPHSRYNLIVSVCLVPTGSPCATCAKLPDLIAAYPCYSAHRQLARPHRLRDCRRMAAAPRSGQVAPMEARGTS